ncbi:MAG: hypothetical protein Q4E88_02935 [Coriobacteriia bacterium]|nr:hypothetical protein [Coriobacteriia bacterium]
MDMQQAQQQAQEGFMQAQAAVNRQKTEEEVKTPQKTTNEQPSNKQQEEVVKNAPSDLDLLNMASTTDTWWDKDPNRPLTGDCVRIDYRYLKNMETKLIEYTDKGEPKLEFLLTLIDEDERERKFAFNVWGNGKKALVKALKAINPMAEEVYEAIGKNITFTSLGKIGNAYQYRAQINGNATHKTDGVYKPDGTLFNVEAVKASRSKTF